MSVFIVFYCLPYEGDDIHSVWSSEEDAEAAVARYSVGCRVGYYEVREFAVHTEPFK
jgi:hypothetical protein